MHKKKIIGFIYLFTALAAVYLFGGYFIIEQAPSDYEKSISKLKYQLDFENIYCMADNAAVKETNTDSSNAEKTVYLTFDDGPSARTEEILDILDEYDIKATFFIVYNDSDKAKEIISRTYESGHTIGVHSTSHSYKEIYKSVDSFLSDFETCFEYIKDITGDIPSIFRFPGGSVNSYNKAVRKDIAQELVRRGFTYFDWNVSGEDATKSYSEESIYNNVVMGCKGRSHSVVLLHDSAAKKETVAALKRIIPDLLEEGYVFKALDENAQPTIFRID
ncbi:MAG: polysaccharide deacetylase [Oscillospiraceae bacterium]|nr:polysaccharide deacetylase [Oscillospiraceae bacterium]